MIYKLDRDNQITELTSDFVEYLYSKYVPGGSLLVPDGIDYNLIKDPASYPNIIFDWATNPVPVNTIEHIKLNNFIICSGFYTFFKTINNPIIKFFPFWLLWMSQQPYSFSSEIKRFKVSCLNGTSWEHRKLTYLELSKKDYFDQIVFTYKHGPTIPGMSEIVLTNEEKLAIDSLPHHIFFKDDDSTVGIDLTINHPAYQNSYINLVTETVTNIHKPMLSEKTFKPIIAGQLFVLIAPPGAINFLRQIGIDTFDDIINHAYDSIPDTRIRIKAAIEQLDYLMQQDLEIIYKKIKHRLMQNSEHFRSEKFRSQFLLTF